MTREKCLTQTTEQGAHALQQGLRPWLEENSPNFLHSFTATQVSLLSGPVAMSDTQIPARGKKKKKELKREKKTLRNQKQKAWQRPVRMQVTVKCNCFQPWGGHTT